MATLFTLKPILFVTIFKYVSRWHGIFFVTPVRGTLTAGETFIMTLHTRGISTKFTGWSGAIRTPAILLCDIS